MAAFRLSSGEAVVHYRTATLEGGGRRSGAGPTLAAAATRYCGGRVSPQVGVWTTLSGGAACRIQPLAVSGRSRARRSVSAIQAMQLPICRGLARDAVRSCPAFSTICQGHVRGQHGLAKAVQTTGLPHLTSGLIGAGPNRPLSTYARAEVTGGRIATVAPPSLIASCRAERSSEKVLLPPV